MCCQIFKTTILGRLVASTGSCSPSIFCSSEHLWLVQTQRRYSLIFPHLCPQSKLEISFIPPYFLHTSKQNYNIYSLMSLKSCIKDIMKGWAEEIRSLADPIAESGERKTLHLTPAALWCTDMSRHMLGISACLLPAMCRMSRWVFMFITWVWVGVIRAINDSCRRTEVFNMSPKAQ